MITDANIIKALECCSSLNIAECDNCPFRSQCDKDETITSYALDIINRLKAEIKVKRKLLEKAEVKIEALEMDKKQLETDIFNANMNLELLQRLYEERATLCEEQDRQILELETEVDRLRNDAAVLPQHKTAVVRCKDCKWYGKVTCAMDDPYSVSDNNFCCFGTRKVVLANDTNGSSEQT